jgi:hypothetical protein
MNWHSHMAIRLPSLEALGFCHAAARTRCPEAHLSTARRNHEPYAYDILGGLSDAAKAVELTQDGKRMDEKALQFAGRWNGKQRNLS